MFVTKIIIVALEIAMVDIVVLNALKGRHCCSGYCENGQCAPECNKGHFGHVCNENNHCCSGNCDGGHCGLVNVNAMSSAELAECNKGQVGQICKENRHCCSGYCENGQCAPECNKGHFGH
eukprot:Pgem_evm1s15329